MTPGRYLSRTGRTRRRRRRRGGGGARDPGRSGSPSSPPANVDVVTRAKGDGDRESDGRFATPPPAAATPLGGRRRRGLMGTGETTAEEYDDDNDGRATLPVNARSSVVALLPPESATSTIASDTVDRTMI